MKECIERLLRMLACIFAGLTIDVVLEQFFEFSAVIAIPIGLIAMIYFSTKCPKTEEEILEEERNKNDYK
jgi:hypothetical protein